MQQRKLDELTAKLQAAERRAEQAERSAHLAESDAHHKDQELSETLSRVRLYESVSRANLLTPRTRERRFLLRHCDAIHQL